MARLPRIVLPNTPHHVTQRGNRRQTVFFTEDDYARYIDQIATFAGKANTEVLAYCLMPNHVHFVMVPSDEDGLRAALSEAHRRYTRQVNARQGWRGHLWQERFHSFPMDEAHLYTALRYVELNPVRAGLVAQAAQWQWSSARAHLAGQSDALVCADTQQAMVADWRAYLDAGIPTREAEQVERHLRTGRPMGDKRFIDQAQRTLNRTFRKQRPGPKPKAAGT